MLRFPTARRDSGRFDGLNARVMAGAALSDERGARLLRQHGAQPGAAGAPGGPPRGGALLLHPLLLHDLRARPAGAPGQERAHPLPARRGLRPDEGGAPGLRERAGRRLPRPGRARPGRLAVRPLPRRAAAGSRRGDRHRLERATPGASAASTASRGRFMLYAGRKDAGQEHAAAAAVLPAVPGRSRRRGRPQAGAHRPAARRHPPGRARGGGRPGLRGPPGQVRRLRRRRRLRAAVAAWRASPSSSWRPGWPARRCWSTPAAR